MIYTQLLAIQLMPDFLWIAGGVVLLHWIWLFVIKKGGVAPSVGLKMSNPQEAIDILPVSRAVSGSNYPGVSKSVSYQAESAHPSTPNEPSQAQSVPSQPSETQQKTGQETSSSPYNPLAEKYAGVSVLPIIYALQQNELDPVVIQELNELALLTRENGQQVAPWEALSGLLSASPPSLAFIA